MRRFSFGVELKWEVERLVLPIGLGMQYNFKLYNIFFTLTY